MKVGYVVKRYPRYSETFIVNEILAHERAGLDVEIFALHPSVDPFFQDILAKVRAPVHYLPWRSYRATEFWNEVNAAASKAPGGFGSLADSGGMAARDVMQASHLALVASEKNIDHFHAHFATSATAVARLASKLTGIPYSFTAHAKDIFHEDVDIANLHGMFRDASAAITVSNYNLSYLRKTLGVASPGLVKIYNGLQLANFRFGETSSALPSIIGIGRLVEKKGFSDLIEACGILKNRNVLFDCQIVGAGEEEAALRQLIGESGLEDAVALCGPRPQREIVGLIRGASVLAAPCVVGEDGNRDGLPTVLLEAMALGTACVATDVTGIPEVVRDRETGLLLAPGDTVALADALQSLLADNDLRCRLARRARALIEEEFDIDRNTRQIRSLFSRAAASDDKTLQRVAL